MKLSQIFIILFLILTACGSKTTLDKEDKKWLVYQPGDTLIFESEQGDFDTTFITEEKVFHVDYNPIELHGKYQPQIGQIWYFNRDTPNMNDGKELVYLEKKEPDQKADGFISYLNETFFFDSDNFDKLDKEILIRDKGYADIIQITSSRRISTECQTIAKIWWSISNGIVQYETCEGIKWMKK